MHAHTLSTRFTLAGLLLAASSACLAQYKVVGPDGKVTYTDRPAPDATTGQVLTVRPGQTVVRSGGVQWPPELRDPVNRFPVSLYTGADCPPCDSARKLLQQRGVPFAEFTVTTQDDINALQRQTGGRTLPSAMVGSQALRGLQDTEWHNTLDLAGYPKESRLPRNYQAPAVAPLAGRPAPDVTANAPAAPAPRSEPTAPQPATRGIRF